MKRSDGELGATLVGSTGWLGHAISDRVAAQALEAGRVLELSASELARLVGRQPVLINAAGSRVRDLPTLHRWNVELAQRLLTACRTTGTFLIHLGSAAEYGLASAEIRWTEDDPPAPVSDYGRSKLTASAQVAEQGGCVLRVFNVYDPQIQPGSPLADIHERIKAGVVSRRDVEVMNAATTRDWISRDFVADSVAVAVELRPAGIHNICSGVPVTMGEIITSYLAACGGPVGLRNLGSVPANSVIGSPAKWRHTSGLTAAGQATDVADALLRANGLPAAASSNVPTNQPGEVR